MPKACSPFPTEVSPLQGCFKTFRVRLFILDWKRKKTQSGLVSLVPWKSGTTQSYPHDNPDEMVFGCQQVLLPMPMPWGLVAVAQRAGLERSLLIALSRCSG